MSAKEPVPSGSYTENYFLESCGGAEFYEKYGPRVPKPALAYALKRADMKEGMRVLDIGCGRGEILYHAKRAGALPVGTDYAEAALSLAAKAAGCPVLRCDAKSLPFPDGIFDRIFFIGVMDHLHDWELERCFLEMRRVLRPGGFVLIHTCVNRRYFKALTYNARRGLVRVLNTLGAPLKEPQPPRSGEDKALHVNEHSEGDLAAFFAKIGWKCRIEPVPGHKHLVRELYGETPEEGLPIRPAPAWKSALTAWALKTPLKDILAREFFVEARPL